MTNVLDCHLQFGSWTREIAVMASAYLYTPYYCSSISKGCFYSLLGETGLRMKTITNEKSIFDFKRQFFL